MNKYILCYRNEKGNIPCKTPLDEYITGTDIEDVNINSTWDWEYLINKYGEKKLIILESKKDKQNENKKIPWGLIITIYIIILIIKVICLIVILNYIGLL